MSFTNIGDIASGVVGKQFTQINLAKKQIDALDAQISAGLQAAKAVHDTVGLPAMPDLSQISDHFSVIDAGISDRFGAIAGLSSLGGPCLSGAKNALKSLSLDSTGMATDLFDFSGFTFPDIDFPEINLPFPSFAMDLSGLFSGFRLGVGSLGISDKIQGLLTVTLPCIDDVSLFDAKMLEIDTLTSQLGLNSDGTMDDDSFASLVSSKVSAAGLPSSISDTMTLMTNKQQEIVNQITTFAIEQKANYVTPIVKNVVPNNLF